MGRSPRIGATVRHRNIRNIFSSVPSAHAYPHVHGRPVAQRVPRFSRDLGRRSRSAGVPRRRFPEEISTSLTLVSFLQCARLRRSRIPFFSLPRPIFDFTPFRGALSLPSAASVARLTSLQRGQEIGKDNRGAVGPMAKQPARGYGRQVYNRKGG